MVKFDKLLLLDIDGVMTNGKKLYSQNGMPLHKEFYDKDFTALKELTASGFRVVFVSGDDFINKEIAKNRGYEFISARGQNKGKIAQSVLRSSDEDFVRVIAVGDDVFDLDMAPFVDTFYLPANSHWRLLSLAENDKKFCVLTVDGGNGVVLEVGERELQSSDLTSIMQRVLILDAAETF